MGYSVRAVGRLRLPEQDGPRAHALLRARMLAVEDSGWLRDDEPTDTLEELAPYAAAQLVREGDELLVVPDEDLDSKWSHQATAFWTGLGELVSEGRVDLEGEDGSTFSYEFTPTGVVRRGTNGWDGSSDGTGLPTGEGDDEDDEGVRDVLRRAFDDPAVRRRRSRRYLFFGGVAAAGGAALLATGDNGVPPLVLGGVNLLVGWRLSRPR